MKKTLATIGITSALAFAGLGVATVASAQTADSDADTDNAESTESTEERTRDGRRGAGRGHRGGGGCGNVAELLGLEPEELRAQLDAGATLAEVAEANGVDADELVDLMVAEATERLDEKVADGRLTEDEAAERLADKAERIEDRVFGDDDADSTADTADDTDDEEADA